MMSQVKLMADQKIPGAPLPKSSRPRVPRWTLPVSIAIAGLGAAATILLRGCWHRNMSWPTRAEDEHGHFSYQVCIDCGVKRLFDERAFLAYGPFGYDLHDLIAQERLDRRRRMEKAAVTQPHPPESSEPASPHRDEAVGE